MPSLPTVPTLLLLTLLLFLTLRYILLPTLIHTLTQLRIRSVSPRSIRGIEWRPRNARDELVPVLRVERVSWGRRREEGKGGWITIRVEGVTVRVKKGVKGGGAGVGGVGSGGETAGSSGGEGEWEKESPSLKMHQRRQSSIQFDYSHRKGKPHGPSTLKATFKSLTLSLLTLTIQHLPWLARLLDLHISDVRIIFTDLDGLELAVADVRAGVGVTLHEGPEDEHGHGGMSPVSPTPLSPFSPDSSRGLFSVPSSPLGYPLDRPMSPNIDHLFSPPFTPSPPTSYQTTPSHSAPASSKKPAAPGAKPASSSSSKPARSKLQALMSTRAGRLWTRAIGRARGTAEVWVRVEGVGVGVARWDEGGGEGEVEGGSRGSSVDLGRREGGMGGGGLQPEQASGFLRRKRTSSNVATAGTGPAQAFGGWDGKSTATSTSTSTTPNPSTTPTAPTTFPAFLFPTPHSPTRPASHPESYLDMLLAVTGRTDGTLRMGFGRHGVLGEESVEVEVGVGEVEVWGGGVERVVRGRKGRKEGDGEGEEEEEEEVKGDGLGAKVSWCVVSIRRAFSDANPHPHPQLLLSALSSAQLAIPSIKTHYSLSSPRRSVSSSASSSATADDHEKPTRVDFDFTVDRLSLQLQSISSLSHEPMRDRFGAGSCPLSVVKGLSALGNVGKITLGGKDSRGREDEVFCLRQVGVDGWSSWRVGGAEPRKGRQVFRDEMEVQSVMGAVGLGSLFVLVPVGLVQDVQKIKAALPVRSKPPKMEDDGTDKTLARAPPRIGISVASGSISAVLGGLGPTAASSLARCDCDGFEFAIESSYRDLVAVRRDRQASKKAFQKEDDLEARRDRYRFEAWMPDEMLRPEVRRRWASERARLPHDMCFAMDVKIRGMVSEIAVRVFANRQDHDLLRIGEMDVRSDFAMLGRTEEEIEPLEMHHVGTSHWLDRTSQQGDASVSIVDGVQVTFWRTEVQKATAKILEVFRTSSPQSSTVSPSAAPTKHEKTLLDRLPSGICIRTSLGLVSVMLASNDPNPQSKLKLLKGLRVQMKLAMDFAYYKYLMQTRPQRGGMSSAERVKFSLVEDCSTQALASATQLSPVGGRSALFTIMGEDLIVHPIHNADGFRRREGARPEIAPPTPLFPQRSRKISAIGWDFQRVRDHPQPKSTMVNSIDPIDLSPQAQSKQPFLLIPKLVANFNPRIPAAGDDLHSTSVARCTKASVVGDLSHIYCALLAVQAIKALGRPGEVKAKTKSKASDSKHRVEVNLDSLHLQVALPLQEQLFLSMRHLSASTSGASAKASLEAAVFYVPSPRAPGRWEELGRFKNLGLQFQSKTETEDIPAIDVSMDALRVRIPFRYEMSKLVLNINMAIKATKILVEDMHTSHFTTVRVPLPEEPKKTPNIRLRIGHVTFEIKDDPIETKLNLIWRVGLGEQQDRLERDAAFEAKAAAINAAENGHPDSEINHPGSHWGFNARHSVSIEDARERLHHYNGDSWTKRFRAALAEQHRREDLILNRTYGSRAHDLRLPIDVLEPERFSPLFRVQVEALDLQITRPKLDRSGIIEYMESLAGPFQKDVEFNLMVPMELKIQAESIDCKLRDYPLPIGRIPRTEKSKHKAKGDPFDPAFVCEMRLIIAEEQAGQDSYYLVPCPVLLEDTGMKGAGGLTLQIAKTIMPVKTYTAPKVQIRTGFPMDFCWGSSYQPAIQDLVKVFDTFSHPPRDPSSKPGFWDKLRLSFHWQIAIDYDGPCHLHFKGSRDPYAITEHGAGFVLAWSGNVRITVGVANQQRELIQIISDEMVFSIPDLTAYIDEAATGTQQDVYMQAGKDAETLPTLLERRGNKTCARFVNGVRVGFGFVFERTCRPHTCAKNCSSDDLSLRLCRLFDFIPHRDVILRTPESVEEKSEDLGREFDSFEGFRSDFIHFSCSIVTTNKLNQDKSPSEKQSSSFHFSPKGFKHFFAWWGLFNSAMSLPIRQGSLFPKAPPASKKFGRSLATIKYRFDIAPLFISHMYQQYVRDDWLEGNDSSLGLKACVNSFQADLHQRQQVKVIRNTLLDQEMTVKHKPFYAVDVFLEDLHLKAISASFHEPVRSLLEGDDDLTASRGPQKPLGQKVSEMSGADRSWYSFDDFVDTDSKPSDRDPSMTMHTIAKCPKFHYSRWISARVLPATGDAAPASFTLSRKDIQEASKFGREGTHYCLLGADKGVDVVQRELTIARINELQAELEDFNEPDDHRKSSDPEFAQVYQKVIRNKLKILRGHLDYIDEVKQQAGYDVDLPENNDKEIDKRRGMKPYEGAEFDNVYHIHSPTLSLNNESRNIIMKYWFSSRTRKGLEYHMSNSALKALREQLARAEQPRPQSKTGGLTPPESVEKPNVEEVLIDKGASLLTQGLLKLLLPKSDPEKASEKTSEDEVDWSGPLNAQIQPDEGLPSNYTAQKSHFLLLLKPQIALRSNMDDDSVVILAVEAASFRGFTITDPEFVGDDVNAHVMHRNYASLRGLQSFYPANKFDVQRKNLQFVPLEVLLDTRSESIDFDRIISKSDGKLQYDKFNKLRLSSIMNEASPKNGELPEHMRHHQDLAIVEVPRLAVMADSKHYGAMFNVVTDLLLYQDPDQRVRSQKLDTYIYAFDRQASGYPLLQEVGELQARIRDLMSLQMAYDDHYDHLTLDGKLELVRIKAEVLEAVESLNLIFDAVSAAQLHDEKAAALKSSTKFMAHAGEVGWHMLGPQHSLIAKLVLKGVGFSWTSKKDSSTENDLVIRDLQALNSSPDALFSEMLAKHGKAAVLATQTDPFAQVSWAVLAPVGGISIIEHFDFKLHPVKVQIEKVVGKQIMNYVFQDRQQQSSTTQIKSGREGSGTATPTGRYEVEQTPSDLLARKLAKVAATAQHGTTASSDHLDTPTSLPRASSSVSLSSAASDVSSLSHPRSRPRSSSTLNEKYKSSSTLVEAAEMRNRASSNRTFLSIRLQATTFVLSYKGAKAKSLMDLYDFKFATPAFEYAEKTWSFEDLVQELKRDIIKSAWSQKGALLKEVFRKHRHPNGSTPVASRSSTNLTALAGSSSSSYPPLLRPSHLRISTQRSPSPNPNGRNTPEIILGDEPLVTTPEEEKSGMSLISQDDDAKAHDEQEAVSGQKEKGKVGRMFKKLMPGTHSDTLRPDPKDEDERFDSMTRERIRQLSQSVSSDTK